MIQIKSIRGELLKKILIFGPNWIGDTVMSTPMVSSLREAFPSAYIVMLVKPYVYPLWKTNHSVDDIWVFKFPRIYNIFAYLKLFLKIKKNHFDLAIILPHCFRYTLLTFLAGIPYRIGYNVISRRFFLTHALDYNLNLRSNHMVDNYLDILRTIGIKPEVKEPMLDIDLESEARASDILSKHKLSGSDLIIGIAPGAIYGKAKRWPSERYAELADRIIEKYQAKIMVFIGPMEKELGYGIKKLMLKRPLIFNGNNSLLEIAALVKRCNLFITNDSGLMHVAAAVSTKIIAIFGSTSPSWTKPHGNGHVVIKKTINCSPCFKRECHLRTYNCLKSITVEEVLRAVDIQLKNKIN